MRQQKFDATLRAAEWLLRIEDGPLTDADKAEFLAWLKASPVNVREYLGVARAGRRLPIAFNKQTPDWQEVRNLRDLRSLIRRLRLAEHKRLTEHKGRRKINGGSSSG